MPPPHIVLMVDDQQGFNIDLLHGIPYVVTLGGDHGGTQAGDWAVFVPLNTAGSCSGAAALTSNGGAIDTTFSFTAELSAASAVYALCLAHGPFGAGGVTDSDFDYHPHVTATLSFEPPSRPPPPSAPPPSPPPPVYGCTSSIGLNYAPSAVLDDGGCIILGCTDSRTSAYDPLANHDNGRCPIMHVGCTDSAAENYRAIANIDSGDCHYVGCMESAATNYDPVATLTGVCIDAVPGCMDTAAANYFPNANTQDDSCLYLGCADSTSVNFDPTATEDDHSCVQPAPGCTNTLAINYSPLYNVDDGTCIVLGCTDPTSPKYNPDATHSIPCGRRLLAAAAAALPASTANSSQGCCPLAAAANYAPGCMAACAPDFACCSFPVRGCRDPTAINYVDGATADDDANPCIPSVEGCVVSHNTLDFKPDANRMSTCVWAWNGCVDPSASNFVPLANVDDASCRYDVAGCADPSGANFDSTATVSVRCYYQYAGCVDPSAINFVPDATIALRSDCRFASYGCGIPQAILIKWCHCD